MIIISKKANKKLFSVVGDNLGRTRSYGSPTIHYWYRNVAEALRLIDIGFDKKEGNYKEPLEKSLGVVHYDVRCVGNEAVYIVTDFDFNYATIRSYLNRAKTTDSTQTTHPITPLYSNPSNQVVSSRNIGNKVECCQLKDGTIRLQYKGRNMPLKSQFDRMLSPFRQHKDGEYAIGEKDGIKYKLFANDTTQAITESIYKQILFEDTLYNEEIVKTMRPHKKVIRLTESELMGMIVEFVKRVLNETCQDIYRRRHSEII